MYEYRRLTDAERRAVVLDRWLRGVPPHAPPHPPRDAQAYLITAACFEHRHIMNTPERRQKLLDLLHESAAPDAVTLAWVALPNHYHLLVQTLGLPAFSSVVRRVHGATSRYWKAEDGTPGRKVWYRFTDRAIRNEAHWFATLNYIHQNPAKHGYVRELAEWPNSSVHELLDQYGESQINDWYSSYPVLNMGKGWDD